MKQLLLFTVLFITVLFIASPTFALAQHTVTLSWTWTQGNGGQATGFIVQRGTVTGGPYATICGGTGQPTCPPVTQFTYVDTSGTGNVLTEGATYYYVVAATGPGGVSATSNEAKALIPFLPPNPASNLQAVPK
jgi:hypothetical protein